MNDVKGSTTVVYFVSNLFIDENGFNYRIERMEPEPPPPMPKPNNLIIKESIL